MNSPSRSPSPSNLDRRVRHAVYRHFIDTAEPPDLGWLAREVGEPPDPVRAALGRLAAAHAIVLAPDSDEIRMAHPFSAVPTAYTVSAGGRSYRANCAWDALGIPVVLDTDSECDALCPDCGEPLSLDVSDGRVTGDDAVVHFLVPPARFWEDIGYT